VMDWNDQRSFQHLVMYATTPPELPKTYGNSHGMRFWIAQVLNDLGQRYRVDEWLTASAMFNESGELIIDLCRAAMQEDREKISRTMLKVAGIEQHAYGLLK